MNVLVHRSLRNILGILSPESIERQKMILYIDETENDDYFIVAGLLVESPTDVLTSYKRFKKKIKGISIPSKYKAKVYTEFKSTLLDRDYRRIKQRMLMEIQELNGAIIYSCRLKKGVKLNQVLKESLYITLLSSIFGELSKETTVIFDRFGKPDFENNIKESANAFPCIKDIYPRDSQTEPGLQFIDNICSVIRMYRSQKDTERFYDLIEKMVKEV